MKFMKESEIHKVRRYENLRFSNINFTTCHTQVYNNPKQRTNTWEEKHVVKNSIKMPADVVGYVYAAALAAGGLMGFIKKGSIASGAAGAVTGALAGLGAYQSSQDPRRYHLILTVAFVMTAVMGNRQVITSKKFCYD